ncbi:transposase [Micromonospora sp. ATCC 39149]|nr:transposase [Micromonospora sp. ATCC 39149]
MLDSGRTIRDVGRELGVNHETLRNWVDRLRQERDGGRPSDLVADERAELVRLRRQVAQLELEKEILKKSRAVQPVVATPCRKGGAMAYGPGQRRVRECRGQMPSPGRPTVAWREDRVKFLGCDPVRCDDRGRGRGGGCVVAGGVPVVPARWRRESWVAADGVGPLSVVL